MKGLTIRTATPLAGLAVTKDTILLICEGMKIGLLYEDAATIAGLDMKQIRKLRRDVEAYVSGEERAKDFEPAYVAILQAFIDSVSKAVAEGKMQLLKKMQAAAAEDWKAADRLLQIMDPERFAPTKRIQKTVSTFTNGQSKIVDFDELSDAELDKIIDGDVSADED